MPVLILLRGGDSGHPSAVGIQCGSWQFALLLSGTVVFLLACTALVVWHTSADYRRKTALGFQFLASDVQWNARNLLLWPLASVAVGLLAGFVGIAGGILQGPLLLEMGVLPQVRTVFPIALPLNLNCSRIPAGGGGDDVLHDPLHLLLHLGPVLCL